jgi:hypothetical protein
MLNFEDVEERDGQFILQKSLAFVNRSGIKAYVYLGTYGPHRV